MKVVTVVGTRPEFVQVAPFTRAVRARHEEILLHTGQHYDQDMSDVFFEELQLPRPERRLSVGSGSHGEQTGKLLIEIERVLLEVRPDWVVVFGDTNSTVAAALAAAKLGVPLAHVEAGLRSFDRFMPEELNRVVTDHLANLLLAPTSRAVDNLRAEGITQGVELIGDVRVDLLAQSMERARPRLPGLARQFGLRDDVPFSLATIHRASNTDDPGRLGQILDALSRLELDVLLPIHPRLNKMLTEFGLHLPDNVRQAPPLGFLDLLAVLDGARAVITDSGGLQKEAYMLRRPTVTLRDTTEWVETVEAGWNRLAEPAELESAIEAALEHLPLTHPPLYGEPGVCARIVTCMENHSASSRGRS
ncbi:MAG TPA: UDP-N-acetylglucosamine 2-epimerase (non-hydrolyzing) [Polyangiaceae bacterium]|nr:UDP-N-acetylglucosamine 2-epimerase (non-hydrolyzing) [Polyangiaceae bacterium]